MNKIMTHVVAGYPSIDDCLEVIISMAKAGVHRIEVQIPFSDPSADGPVIMEANDAAIENGVTMKDAFEIVRKAREAGVKLPIYLMSYANKVSHVGTEEFCKQAANAGASGFILPDLALGTPEYETLVSACAKHKLAIVPVVSPGTSPDRLSRYLEAASDIVYLTSMKGITGKSLAMDTSLSGVVKAIKTQKPEVSVALGFGIKTPADVTDALTVADEAVVGSAVIHAINESGTSGALTLVQELVEGSNG